MKPATPQTEESLRRHFDRQLQAALSEAERNGNGMPPAQVEHLAQLARVIEVSRANAPQTSHRGVVISLIAATLVLASVLLFVRVRQTEVEGDALVSHVSFETEQEQPIARAIHSLRSLHVGGVRALHLPDAAEPASSDDGDLSVAVSTREGRQPGQVSLAQLSLPAGARVHVEQSELPHQLRIVLETPRPLQLAVDVYGSVRVSSRLTPQRDMDLVAPQRVLLEMASNEADLLFTTSASGTVGLLPRIAVRRLSFLQPQQFADAQSVGPLFVRAVSGIQSGTLNLEELGGKAIALHSGEPLRFEGFQGHLRQVAVQDGRISVKFGGIARGMQTGSEEHPRSLMPTLLEWLRARQGLLLMWGMVLYFASLSAGVLRWLGVRL
jgi:hypothetical protein